MAPKPRSRPANTSAGATAAGSLGTTGGNAGVAPAETDATNPLAFLATSDGVDLADSRVWIAGCALVTVLCLVITAATLSTHYSTAAVVDAVDFVLNEQYTKGTLTAEQYASVLDGVIRQLHLLPPPRSDEEVTIQVVDAPGGDLQTSVGGTNLNSPPLNLSTHVVIDERRIELSVSASADLAAASVDFCIQHTLKSDYCYQVYRHLLSLLPPNTPTPAAPAQRLATYFASPSQEQTFLSTQDIPLQIAAGNKAHDAAIPLSACVYVDDAAVTHGAPTWCGQVPASISVGRGARPGVHLLRLVTSGRGSAKLDEHVIFFNLVSPSVTLRELALTSVGVEVTAFGEGDGAVCVIVTGDMISWSQCVSGKALPSKLQTGNGTAVVSVPLRHSFMNGQFGMYACLVTPYKHCLARTDITQFNVNLPDGFRDANAPPLRDPRAWLTDLEAHEFGVFSQNGEDGVLDAIFRHIGTTQGRIENGGYFVEFGVYDGTECNSRALREYYNWTGLLMDGGFHNEAWNLQREWITAENIMDLFAKHGVPGEFDLLSIDVDFNDYWIWRAIDQLRYRPRVVLVEVNSHIPANDNRTVRYDPNHGQSGTILTTYFGASVGAMATLGASKGYTLLYCESHGVNCFFVRRDLLPATLPAGLTAAALYRPPNYKGVGERHPEGSGPWVRV